jgi:hypothetical protein
MPKRATRESSVENGSELRARGKLVRQQMAAALQAIPPAGPSARPPMSRIGGGRGALADALAWLAKSGVALNPKVLSAFGADGDSLLYDSIYGVILRAMEQANDPSRWSERTEPVILPYRDGRIRFGIFDWTTDSDAFIEAMLGRPVPRRPRYEQDVPIVPARFAGEFDVIREQLGASIEDTIALFGMTSGAAARETGPLDRVAVHMADGDAVVAAVQQATVRIDPDGFAASPLGRLELGVMRAAPRWRTPGADFELASAYDLGLGGTIGMAFWSGAWGLRSYRRAMAAHLRHLFDYAVAPQRRWPDARTQREAMTVWLVARDAGLAEPGQSVTRPKIARHLRRENPADYEGEDEAVTVRRLYRLSAAMHRPEMALPARSGA